VSIFVAMTRVVQVSIKATTSVVCTLVPVVYVYQPVSVQLFCTLCYRRSKNTFRHFGARQKNGMCGRKSRL